jgi:hypothetical protein
MHLLPAPPLMLQVLGCGKAVLGYVVYGPVALLLMAESVRVSAILPGGHEIKTVTQSKWHRISLQVHMAALASVASSICNSCVPVTQHLLKREQQCQQEFKRMHGESKSLTNFNSKAFSCVMRQCISFSGCHSMESCHGFVLQ